MRGNTARGKREAMGSRDDNHAASDEDDDAGLPALGGDAMDEHSDEEEIPTDFEFYPFHAGDWHGVKQHCLRLLDGRVWDVGGLATIVTEQQQNVGSVIKLGERTTEALGMGAVINLQQFSDAPCIQSIVEFVLSRFRGHERDQMAAALSNSRVGLFLNERVLNMPPLLALPLHQSIFEEMQACNSAHVAHKVPGRAPYDFDYLLFITVTYNDSRGDSSVPRAEAKKHRETVTQLEWFHPEEEVYMENAVCTAVWPISAQDEASKWTFDGRITQSKVIMLVPTSAIPKILARFESINNGDEGDD